MENIENNKHYISTLICDNKILFEGTYNINNLNQTDPTITNIQILVEINPKGYNLLVDNFYNTKNNLIPPTNFILETISITSYTKDMIMWLGQIQFTAFYKNDSR